MELLIGFGLALFVLWLGFKLLFKKGKGRQYTKDFDDRGRNVYDAPTEFKGAGITITKEVPKAKKASAKNEHYYNQLIAADFQAESGVKLDNGLIVDMMDEDTAYEIDFGGAKIYEGIGQSLSYAYFTDKKPGLIILVRDDKEQKMLDILEPVIHHHGIDLYIYKVTDRIEGTYEEVIESE